ncbi:hypothetical protein E4U53_002154, partial [Claviceps sorghi]
MANITFTTSTRPPAASSSNAILDALKAFCLDNPDSPKCDGVESYYEYRPSLTANAIFLGLYSASFVGFAVTWALTRRAGGFNMALMLGLLCEILGYAGRVMSADNPWEEGGFMIQICCLTIGPAFMAAGCYLCLKRIVTAFGPENSWLKPQYYTLL